MTHDYHEGLPGYHPDQLLHDGCAECEGRTDPQVAIGHMDAERFAKAWRRASDLNRSGGPYIDTATLSDAELPVLGTLWAIIVQLEPRGVPTTEVPGRDLVA